MPCVKFNVGGTIVSHRVVNVIRWRLFWRKSVTMKASIPRSSHWTLERHLIVDGLNYIIKKNSIMIMIYHVAISTRCYGKVVWLMPEVWWTTWGKTIIGCCSPAKAFCDPFQCRLWLKEKGVLLWCICESK